MAACRPVPGSVLVPANPGSILKKLDVQKNRNAGKLQNKNPEEM
jgi:hypothetical protein